MASTTIAMVVRVRTSLQEGRALAICVKGIAVALAIWIVVCL